MRVIVQLLDTDGKAVGSGHFDLADLATESIMRRSQYKRDLECDRAALKVSVDLMIGLGVVEDQLGNG